METTYIINSFFERFKKIQKSTKKKLTIKDVIENLIIGEFYDFCFSIIYIDSNKKHKNYLYCKDKEIYKFLKTLSNIERKEKIKEIHFNLLKLIEKEVF